MQWPTPIWAFFTMHPNGFVREAAVRHLIDHSPPQRALPFLLLRLNDWVPQVNSLASEAVRRFLTLEHLAVWSTVLGMIADLQLRSRVDHAWLGDAVAELFARPQSRTTLGQAVQSSDRAVARWAFNAAMQLLADEPTSFIDAALSSDDPYVRKRAAVCVRQSRNFPCREQLLERMRADPCMPIRREALYAILEDSVEIRTPRLKAALFDMHPSMRHAARFYLRDDAKSRGESFDPRPIYLDALSTNDTHRLARAIAGLGECGLPADSVQLEPFICGPNATVAAAAVAAIAALDGERYMNRFAELLADPRPAIVKQSCRALLPRAGAMPAEPLRSHVRNSQYTHSRRSALRLLLQGNAFDAVPDAVSALMSDDPLFVKYATEFINSIRPWLTSRGPTDAQRSAAASAIAACEKPLPSGLLGRVHAFLQLSPR